MNLLNIALILTATASASVNASDATAKERSLVNYKAPLRLSPDIINAGGNLYNDAISVCFPQSRVPGKTYNLNLCNSKLNDLRVQFSNAKTKALDRLEKEYRDVDTALAHYPNLPAYNNLKSLAYGVIDGEKNDWNKAQEAISHFDASRMGGSLTVLGNVATFKQKIVNMNGVMQNLSSNSLGAIIGKESQIRDFKDNFKKWIVAVKYFGNPNPDAPVTEVDLDEFIKATPVNATLRAIDIPAGRFRVGPIDRNLNIYYLMGSESDRDLTPAVKTAFMENFKSYKKRLQGTSLAADVGLRQKVVNALFAPADRSYDEDVPLKELVGRRLFAFKRVVDGIVSSIEKGDPVSTDLITEVIKMWLMAVQMVSKDGWKGDAIPYGLLPLPDGVVLESTPEPAAPTPTPTVAPEPTRTVPESNKENASGNAVNVMAAKNVNPSPATEVELGKRKRSDTLDTVASTDSNVSNTNTKSGYNFPIARKLYGLFGASQ